METKPEFKTLKITRLHPTFGAEVSGVDFSHPIPDDVLQEIISAMAKVVFPILKFLRVITADRVESSMAYVLSGIPGSTTKDM